MSLKISELNDMGGILQPKDAAIRDSSGARLWKRPAGEGSGGNGFVIPCTALRCRFIFVVEPSV
jgi:hypothetical protein